MDETPEEMEQIRAEAEKIDPNRYRKRFRFLAAMALGATGAGVVALVLRMLDDRRNPCERVRNHLCATAASSTECGLYESILKDSVEDESPTLRQSLRGQCETRIERLAADGVRVP